MSAFSGVVTASRYFIKNRVSSLINISGLAIGLTGFVCIALYVEHELSFDKFHPRHKDTYRIVKDFVNADGSAVADATTPPALAKALRTELPYVETATRFTAPRGRLFLLQCGEKKFYETELTRVDKEFFNVFDLPFVEGTKEKALDQIHSIILTESTARRYFGNESALGKVIRMNVEGGKDYTVSGVLKDIPASSHFTFKLAIPFESRTDPDTRWDFSIFYTYARLNPDASMATLTSDVEKIVKTNVPNTRDRYYVQPLVDIHLHSDLKLELLPNGNMTYIRIMVLIGIFILLIACINYINLVTARSSERAKEVGIRKAVGAARLQLMRQFLLESVLTVTVSLALSLLIIVAALPLLSPLTGVDLSSFLWKSEVIKWIAPFSLLIALTAGIYPAFYLSAFEPLKTLRGSLLAGHKGAGLRKSLVVFQFTMSSGLIAGMLIISGQLDFMMKKDLGFEGDNVILVPNVRGGIGGQVEGSWDESVRQLPGVINISRADGIIGSGNSVNGLGVASTGSHIALNFMRIDHDFIPTMNIHLKDGRNFSKDFISDSAAIIINEEAARQLGLSEPLIGQRLSWDDAAGRMHDVTVVGVAKDFHFTNLHTAIRPFGFILEVNNGSSFFIKVASSNLESTLRNIEQVWNTFNPGRPFDYSFQDQYTAQFHMNDQRFEALFTVFTMLAIAIACMGLFGLTAFLAESRTKEIGVRKILGASVMGILGLVSKEYIVMMVLSLLIAFPLAGYLMASWLQNFAYHISIGWQMFTLAAAISLALAVVTISFHTVRVATRNPVKSLRSE